MGNCDYNENVVEATGIPSIGMKAVICQFLPVPTKTHSAI
jgi:hypothetical protein